METVIRQNLERKEGGQVKEVGPGYARGVPIPWQLKMWLKIVLAYLPVPYGVWKKLGLFQHGDVTKKLPNLYKSFAEFVGFYKERKGEVPERCLELGPGDSVGHALCAAALGVETLTLIDAGDFASRDPRHYQDFYNYVSKETGAEFRGRPQSFARGDVLAFCNALYLTEGLKSMAEIADGSIDFSFSQAVFEHIYRDEFGPYMRELFRAHRPGSLAYHWVDSHDHLGGALNSMRFSPAFWEGKSVKQAGFYTNRLTMKDMVELAEQAGFKVEVPRINKWQSLPTPENKMHEMFQGRDEEELNVCTFLMVMEKL